jgi:uncharacterized membrane protein
MRVLPLLLTLLACTGQAASQAHDGRPMACQGASLSSARQVVTKYCVSCHSPSGAASDYDWSDERALLAHRRNIAAKVGQNSMPPVGQPRPTPSERSTLLCWANE